MALIVNSSLIPLYGCRIKACARGTALEESAWFIKWHCHSTEEGYGSATRGRASQGSLLESRKGQTLQGTKQGALRSPESRVGVPGPEQGLQHPSVHCTLRTTPRNRPGSVIVFILQMRGLRLGEGRAQGHTHGPARTRTQIPTSISTHPLRISSRVSGGQDSSAALAQPH